MTKAVERYEKVRADWLLANEARWHLSDRRMAHELKRAAAKKDRAATGAAESSHHEGQIKPIASRFIAAGEDSKEKMLRAVFLALFILPTLVFWIGPALALSYGLYALDTERRLKQGRVPELKQWFLAAGATAAASWIGETAIVWPKPISPRSSFVAWFSGGTRPPVSPGRSMPVGLSRWKML